MLKCRDEHDAGLSPHAENDSDTGKVMQIHMGSIAFPAFYVFSATRIS